MEKKPLQSGFIDAPIVESDLMFGAFGDNSVKVSDGNWTRYLPKNEKQRQGFESMACTNFSSTNAVEVLMTRLIEDKLISIGNLAWLNENGYIDESGHFNTSDRFDAIVSGTTPQGNTLKAPADAKHKYGMIPEKMLPWTDNQDEYFKKSSITTEMYNMGLEFLKRFPINYEFVYPADFKEALKVSPLATACYAWNGTQNGVFYRVSNTINHAICKIAWADIIYIMDSYEEFVKKLATNYQFSGYAIRYIIREVADNNPATVKKNMYNLRRDPNNPDEVYAITSDGLFKRHIVNAETLAVGAGNGDKYWNWSPQTEITLAGGAEFASSVELAEILLLPRDTQVVVSNTGDKKGLWKSFSAWVKSLFNK